MNRLQDEDKVCNSNTFDDKALPIIKNRNAEENQQIGDEKINTAASGLIAIQYDPRRNFEILAAFHWIL